MTPEGCNWYEAVPSAERLEVFASKAADTLAPLGQLRRSFWSLLLITSVLSSEWWDWGSEHWLRFPLENLHTLLGVSLGSHCFRLYSNQISCPGSQWDSVSFIIPSEKPLSFFSNFNFLIEGWLLYNVVLNSAVQQYESIIIIYMVATVHGVAKSWTWLSTTQQQHIYTHTYTYIHIYIHTYIYMYV